MFYAMALTIALPMLILTIVLGLANRTVRRSVAASPNGGNAPSSLRRSDLEPNLWPYTTLIIPLTGDDHSILPAIRSLLNQDHPNHNVLLVTQDKNDPATATARILVMGVHHARHILAGLATGNGQKNYNLLAGVAATQPTNQVLAFCDASHLAATDFLRRLTAPLAGHDPIALAEVATGYHRIRPLDQKVGTLGMLATVLSIHCLQCLPLFAQPWGGAMAITRSAFERLNVARLWANTVVDDCSLAALLKAHQVYCRFIPEACLTTNLAAVSLHTWWAWLVRQFLYLKYCFPLLWMTAAPIALMLALPPLAALGSIIAVACGWASPSWAIVGLLILAGLTGLANWFRQLLPKPSPLIIFTMILACTMFFVAGAYLRTWITNRLTWRHATYRVTWGARVIETLR
ncbi:conserved membrane hypothetical protein [Desulfovibrionales bacterium]